MINGLLLMLVGTFFWHWLVGYGVPAGILLGIGALTLTLDIGEYSLSPKPGPLLLGGDVDSLLVSAEVLGQMMKAR
ncbi:hypothetical protein [Marinobacter lutaoensis]|uniref:hypothetical protein n=1 Tax=Marinobacter lutaoensis TaxID=135739 RepID=UPI0015936FD1|nr:hypothetical protein [Marinobacter lutaoensis]NVD35740.1 hypothetical protein [Marinobacter lutaoensis]